MTSLRPAVLTVAGLALAFGLASGPVYASGQRVHAPPGARTTTVAPPDAGPMVIIKSQHRRLTFGQDIQRIAVGDAEILSADLITSREVLVLGRSTGSTTLIVWFGKGASREYVISVRRDLSVLQRALVLVHPSIEAEIAPDRDAVVLTGHVPDERVKQSAEAIARNYLEPSADRRGAAEPYVAVPPTGAASTPDSGAPAGATDVPAPPVTTSPDAARPTVRIQGAVAPSASIINLIVVDRLPATTEEKIAEAVQSIGGQRITIRRILHGTVPDDLVDTLVLEGRVPNQVALVRVLTVAARFFAGKQITAQDIRVVADEGGALAEQQNQSQSSQSQLGGGSSSSLFGGARGARLSNQIRTNLGRAKAVELAGGRILSFIEVVDLPQIRVDVRIVEVNRTKLRALDLNAALATSNFRQPSLNPAQSATVVQGDQAARVGSTGGAIQNVVSFLNGGLLNEIQYSAGRAAIDAALSLLERQGIAQSLSSPSLTVLSGEVAQVQIGGEVPVPTAFAPAFGSANTAATPAAATTTPGVFSAVEFVPFGVQLQIRPLVGDDGTITLDLQPQVVTPDAVLTDTIRQSTGAAVPTTAFQTRALRTSSRLQDGQSLIIGGLLSNNSSTNSATTPGLGSLPLLGRFFRNFNRNDASSELVVVVNPVVLREPVPDAAMWSFPGREELMRPIMGVGAPGKR